MELGWGDGSGENGQIGAALGLGMQEVEMGQGILEWGDEHLCLGGR